MWLCCHCVILPLYAKLSFTLQALVSFLALAINHSRELILQMQQIETLGNNKIDYSLVDDLSVHWWPILILDSYSTEFDSNFKILLRRELVVWAIWFGATLRVKCRFLCLAVCYLQLSAVTFYLATTFRFKWRWIERERERESNQVVIIIPQRKEWYFWPLCIEK